MRLMGERAVQRVFGMHIHFCVTPPRMYPIKLWSWLASEGGLTADLRSFDLA
jgi:hypothetical protein